MLSESKANNRKNGRWRRSRKKKRMNYDDDKVEENEGETITEEERWM